MMVVVGSLSTWWKINVYVWHYLFCHDIIKFSASCKL